MAKRPPSAGPPVVVIGGFSRRTLLQAGAVIAGALALPGCDYLALPPRYVRRPAEPGEVIEPITPQEDFYEQQYRAVPTVAADDWTFDIVYDGEPIGTVTRPFLDGLASREREHTLCCIGGGPRNQAIGNAVWEGLPLREIFEELGITPDADAAHMKWVCADDYDTGTLLSDLDTMWLVWGMNGEDLTPVHGYPARILNPGRYGTKNVKWPTSLELLREPHVGYWERRNWSDTATYRAHTLINRPGDRYATRFSRLENGTLRLIGTAFAGDDDVARVEVTSDGGETWTEAELTYNPGGHVWALWAFDFMPPAPGGYTLQARVTTVSGAMSAPTTAGPGDRTGYDGSMAVDVDLL